MNSKKQNIWKKNPGKMISQSKGDFDDGKATAACWLGHFVSNQAFCVERVL